jgi:phosphoglycolate phosphatase
LRYRFNLTLTRPAQPVFLFDIDGTLLAKAGPHHRQALEQAATQISGRPISSEGVPTAGMLDRDILRLMLSQAGIADKRIQQFMPAIVRQAQRIYPDLAPSLRHKVCPGMRAFLARLRRRQAVCGLVTGNLSRIAWCKMERAGLREFFRFGAFAEMGPTRSALVGLALTQARRQGWLLPQSPVYLIGDHLNDIRAARDNSIPIISVATGPMSRQELAAFSPDFLLDDIRSLSLEIIKV